LQRDTTQQIQALGRKWAFEIANGMNHISFKNVNLDSLCCVMTLYSLLSYMSLNVNIFKQVIHGDLSARNILITSNGQAKITDFGLSRKLYMYSNYVKEKQEPLPWRFAIPTPLSELK